jgi:hypothetical protein
MPGYAAISGLITGTTAGSNPLGPFVTAANAAADFVVQGPILPSGNFTVTCPLFVSAGVIIVPNPANTQTLTLKGINGDTGIPLSPVAPTMISWPASPPATFVLTAGGNFTTVTSLIFF